MIYLYLLKQDSIVRYVGLTKNPRNRKSAHRSRKPPHKFEILEKHDDVEFASKREQELIIKYSTQVPNGWNVSSGGEYEQCSGYFRKGIGGEKKGRIPWNKGKAGCFSEDTIKQMRKCRRGVAHSNKFLHLVPMILEKFDQHPKIENVGERSANGVVLTQERAFAKMYANDYGMTAANLWKIVTRKSWTQTTRKTPDTKS